MAISDSVKIGYIDLTGGGSSEERTPFTIEDKQTYVTRVARISVGDSPDPGSSLVNP